MPQTHRFAAYMANRPMLPPTSITVLQAERYPVAHVAVLLEYLAVEELDVRREDVVDGRAPVGRSAVLFRRWS